MGSAKGKIFASRQKRRIKRPVDWLVCLSASWSFSLSVSQSVVDLHFAFCRLRTVFASLFLPKCLVEQFYHCPCLPAQVLKLVILQQGKEKKMTSSLENKQGQVGQKGAPCGSSNKCVTNRKTDRQTQPIIEVLWRT